MVGGQPAGRASMPDTRAPKPFGRAARRYGAFVDDDESYDDDEEPRSDPGRSEEFGIGAAVFVQGLVSEGSRRHNGRRGVVVAPVVDGRHEVRLDEEGVLLRVMPCNLSEAIEVEQDGSVKDVEMARAAPLARATRPVRAVDETLPSWQAAESQGDEVEEHDARDGTASKGAPPTLALALVHDRALGERAWREDVAARWQATAADSQTAERRSGSSRHVTLM